MRFPVDTSAVKFVAGGAPEPALDYDTKAPKLDESGKPIFNVYLFAVGAGGRDQLTVKVVGEPKGIGEFTPVRVHELVATTWSMENRSGVSFRASAIEPLTGTRPAS